jgi:hypothetical protein
VVLADSLVLVSLESVLVGYRVGMVFPHLCRSTLWNAEVLPFWDEEESLGQLNQQVQPPPVR